MHPYRKDLKYPASQLRSESTNAEPFLWRKLRAKQVYGLQFYRQKPLFSFIVDFYCPKAKLVIELDGSQHLEQENKEKDGERDAALSTAGLMVLRFDDRQVFLETDAVLMTIYQVVTERVGDR